MNEQTRLYEYLRIIEVVDGDTIDAEIDLGFGAFIRQRIRLFGINAPEKNTIEGEAAKERLASLFASAKKIRMWTTKTRQATDRKEKYGRYLGQFEVVTEDSIIVINSRMIDEGHAKPYFGERKTN